jgi:uncharacterized protein YbaP (TraB family)
MFRKFAVTLVMALVSGFIAVRVYAQELKGGGSERTVFYEIKSDKTHIFLMGSIHFADENVYPLPRDVIEAFENSANLVVEVDAGSIANQEKQNKFVPMLMYSGKESIKDHLSRRVFSMLENYLKKNNMASGAILKFKPGLLSIILTSRRLMELGFLPKFGIENFFLSRVKGQKNIFELESIEEQMGLFLSIKDADADKFMERTLIDLDRMGKLMNVVVAAWKRGDVQALNKLLLQDPIEEDPSMLPVMKAFFFDRNIRMASKIESLLQRDDVSFVVVGAGHLIGDKGIIAILQNKGIYQIRQL